METCQEYKLPCEERIRELEEKVITLLIELSNYYRKKGKKIVLVQRKNNIAKNQKGIPVDRPAWFYLPFLAKYSYLFQPKQLRGGDGYIYELDETFFKF